MIICPFCRKVISGVSKGEIFCTFCGQKLNTATLPPANIIEDKVNPYDIEQTEDKESLTTFEQQSLALPPAAGPVAVSGFAGVSIAAFALRKFINPVLGRGLIISGLCGLAGSLVFAWHERLKRKEKTYLGLLDFALIDLKYRDYNSAREKIKLFGKSNCFNRKYNLKWITIRNLMIAALDTLSDESESRSLYGNAYPYPEMQLYPKGEESSLIPIAVVLFILGRVLIMTNGCLAGLAMIISGIIMLCAHDIAKPYYTSLPDDTIFQMTGPILRDIKNKNYSSAQNRINDIPYSKKMSPDTRTKMWTFKNFLQLLLSKMEE